MTKGTIYLIPSVIAADTQEKVIPLQVKEAISATRYFIAETVRESRRFISSLNLDIDISTLNFEKVDKNTPATEAEKYLKPALEGNNIGILSDAGCPGVADPGALVVSISHQMGLKVIPLVGPSSLLLALMASGLNGQSFAFNGYLPIDAKEAIQKIGAYEKVSRTGNQTQIFIETPYRSDRTFEILVKNLSSETVLCVARNVTGASELIFSKSIRQWRSEKITIGKEPTVFLFMAT